MHWPTITSHHHTINEPTANLSCGNHGCFCASPTMLVPSMLRPPRCFLTHTPCAVPFQLYVLLCCHCFGLPSPYPPSDTHHARSPSRCAQSCRWSRRPGCRSRARCRSPNRCAPRMTSPSAVEDPQHSTWNARKRRVDGVIIHPTVTVVCPSNGAGGGEASAKSCMLCMGPAAPHGHQS